MPIKKGQKFNRLTAVEFSHIDKYKHHCWLFHCECGNEKVICINKIKTGTTKSCGCFRRSFRKTHGMTKTRTYTSWKMMKDRCYSLNRKSYKDYGGRGIKVCNEWLGKKGFENFYADMGNRPENKSLDRIDNDGNYCKSNCKWSTKKEQQNNMRNNINL